MLRSRNKVGSRGNHLGCRQRSHRWSVTGRAEDWAEEDLVWRDIRCDPAGCFQTLVELVWNEVSPAFGVPNPVEEKVQRETMLLKRLRRHVGRRKAASDQGRSLDLGRLMPNEVYVVRKLSPDNQQRQLVTRDAG